MSSRLPFGPRDGQAIVVMVVAMSLLLVGVLGFAIDGGEMYAQRQLAQAAADAAAQAGMMSILDGTNATSAFTFGIGAAPIASYTCTTTDGRTPCVYARNNGFGGTSSDTVTLSYPTTVSGVSLAAGNVPALKVTIQRNVSTSFVRFIGGPATFSITNKAISAMVQTGSPNSIYVLDPSGKDAFSVTGNANVSVNGGAIAINSSNAEAGLVKGSATVSAGAIEAVGGVKIQGAASATPAPSTLAAPVADPLASLPALTPGSCATYPTNYSPPNGTTLTPGTYCGGISVGSNATVTFSAGNYIINGGGISFGASSVSTGSGVMFYLTGTNATYGSVTGSGTTEITLSAPTSGPYLGILFYQDRSLTPGVDASFGGNTTITLTGSMYFPTTGVSFSGNSGGVSDMAIVAQQVSFSGDASLQHDATGQKTGLFANAAVLAQ
jgi:Flp pilus assembly protein TadG